MPEPKLVYTELPESATGLWRITTRRGTMHEFDLDRRTVRRIPGPWSSATINDRTRPIRTIEACTVGACGFWTMLNDGYTDPNEFYWHRTSIIQTIRPVDDSDPIDAGLDVAAANGNRESGDEGLGIVPHP